MHVCVCARARYPVTPRVGLKALFFSFHKHPVRLLTLLLIEALDLQFSYANYFSNLKQHFTSALSDAPGAGGEWTQCGLSG